MALTASKPLKPTSSTLSASPYWPRLDQPQLMNIDSGFGEAPIGITDAIVGSLSGYEDLLWVSRR